MASHKKSGSKAKSNTQNATRAAAKPPMPPHALRPAAGATTAVPPPVDKLAEAAAKTLKSNASKPKGAPDNSNDSTSPDASDALELKKQELIAMVVERSDVAKKHAKPVIEAMLQVLGEALAEGRELNLQPLGKVKQNRVKDTPRARVIVAKIRQQKPGGPRPKDSAENVKEAVADEAE
ncbi:HU family DNA-binding protein [Rhodobacteraceae bacterium KMM 6894]|nr:HU family DNA-binding protein [Rhodobacteraceae bacterium KMM 6894]